MNIKLVTMLGLLGLASNVAKADYICGCWGRSYDGPKLSYRGDYAGNSMGEVLGNCKAANPGWWEFSLSGCKYAPAMSADSVNPFEATEAQEAY